jgi:hypothetical protein
MKANDELMTDWIVAHLARSSFVVLRGKPAVDHSTL